MVMLKKCFKVLLLTISCATLTACVTEVDGGPARLKTEQGREQAIQAYIDLAMGYVREGQTENAKEPLLDALKLDPSNADANAALGYVFQTEQDYKLAEEYFRKALVSAPNDARILNNYGAFLSEQKRLPEAKKAFLKASEDSFYNGRSMVFENIGIIALQENNLDEAEDYFQRALRINRERVGSILALAEVYYLKGEYPTAQRYYSGFVAAVQGRQSPKSLLLGARLYTALNDKDRAAGYASQLEQLYPSSAEYREYKAGGRK